MAEFVAALAAYLGLTPVAYQFVSDCRGVGRGAGAVTSLLQFGPQLPVLPVPCAACEMQKDVLVTADCVSEDI